MAWHAKTKRRQYRFHCWSEKWRYDHWYICFMCAEGCAEQGWRTHRWGDEAHSSSFKVTEDSTEHCIWLHIYWDIFQTFPKVFLWCQKNVFNSQNQLWFLPWLPEEGSTEWGACLCSLLTVGKMCRNSSKLLQGMFRQGIRENFFTVNVFRHWNRLLSEVVDAPWLLVFKRHLDIALSVL